MYLRQKKGRVAEAAKEQRKETNEREREREERDGIEEHREFSTHRSKSGANESAIAFGTLPSSSTREKGKQKMRKKGTRKLERVC